MAILATDFANIQKHIAITKCGEIADMMLPLLKKHGITVFNYYRMYFDGSVIRLSTDRAWTMHYFKKDYLNRSTVPLSYLTKPINYFIWLTDDCPEMLLDAAINFDTSNGISIAERHNDYMEYFCFATTLSNTSIINNFYINNLDLLRKYCFQFKERANMLLKTYEKKKLILTNINSCKIDFQPDQILRITDSIQLSGQQNACARLLLKGMSCKGIAQEINLSPRTVESYLNNLKNKLKCRNRTELIVKLTDILPS